ncbi:MAG: hypothetical protein QXS20_04340 [Candidatus Thorarchaeota archaeon]
MKPPFLKRQYEKRPDWRRLMAEDWMFEAGIFVDVHSRLMPFEQARKLLSAVELSGLLKEYFGGANSGHRLIFQVLSQEFVSQLASMINAVLAVVDSPGPVLEVMSGGGELSEFLRPLLTREIIATDSKSDGYRICYPKWVRTMDAIEAVDLLSPSFVIISWEPHLSVVGLDIVARGLPLAWIGETAVCGHPELLEKPHIRVNSSYAIGRHDSILGGNFKTDIYLFNCETVTRTRDV